MPQGWTNIRESVAGGIRVVCGDDDMYAITVPLNLAICLVAIRPVLTKTNHGDGSAGALIFVPRQTRHTRPSVRCIPPQQLPNP